MQGQGSLGARQQRLQACDFPQLAHSTRSMLGSAEAWPYVLPGSERALSGRRVSYLFLYSNCSVCRVTSLLRQAAGSVDPELSEKVLSDLFAAATPSCSLTGSRGSKGRKHLP